MQNLPYGEWSGGKNVQKPQKSHEKPKESRGGVRTDVHPVPLKWNHREANNRKMQRLFDRRTKMKGYVISDGYMGYVGGSYMLFASEEEYIEYMSEWEKGIKNSWKRNKNRRNQDFGQEGQAGA